MPLQLTSAFAEYIAALARWSDIALEWLLTYAIHSTVLIVLVWLLTSGRLGERLQLATSSMVWRLALVGGIVTATLQSSGVFSPLGGTLRVADTQRHTMIHVSGTGAVPRFEVGGPLFAGRVLRPGNGEFVVRRHDRKAQNIGFQTEQGVRRVAEDVTRQPSPFTRHDLRLGRESRVAIEIRPLWPLAATAVWMLCAAGFLASFLLARARFTRSLGRRRDARFTVAGLALSDLLDRAKLRRRVAITVAPALSSPVALGNDEICLPERVLSELDPIAQESMIAHELAHVRRHDPAWLTFARVIEALFFFQPLNRLARRRMQEAAEFASDAWALEVAGKPLELARCLARVAEWTSGHDRVLAPAMAERSGSVLVRRVERLTRPSAGTNQLPVQPRAGFAAAGLVAFLALVAPRASIGAPSPGAGAMHQARIFMIERDTRGGFSSVRPADDDTIVLMLRRP